MPTVGIAYVPPARLSDCCFLFFVLVTGFGGVFPVLVPSAYETYLLFYSELLFGFFGQSSSCRARLLYENSSLQCLHGRAPEPTQQHR